MGGQTALNCALDLDREGVLARYGVELIGASRKAIEHGRGSREISPRDGGDRAGDAARARLRERSSPHWSCSRTSVTRQLSAPRSRSAAAAGELHTTVRNSRKSYVAASTSRRRPRSCSRSPSSAGKSSRWRSFATEPITASSFARSRTSIRWAIHTGDSITVAPAQTLTDKEYQQMRDASIAVLRKIGVDTGGSNVQFAASPDDSRLLVIEMNPRVSRSSALASKATGFPIAKVAAKLSVGYTLDELRNEITGGATPASFEPTHRLCRDQSAALYVREVSAGRRPAHHADEIRGRGHGDGAHFPGVAAEGVARTRNGRRRS